jgi:iron(III) transport system permease protein
VTDRAIAVVFAAAVGGLALVVVSLAGNLVGSITAGSDVGTFTLANFAALFADPALAPVVGRTVVLGGGSVALTLFFAIPLAWLIARTDFPWKGGMFTLLTAKLAIPGFITAMSYVWLFNPTSGIVNKMLGGTGVGGTAAFDVYGLSWICFLHGLVLTPAAVFMMLPAFRNMDLVLEEAAWASGVSRPRALRRIVLPLLAPGILAAGLFFFVIAIEIFDIVGLIGLPGDVKVLVLWIYDAMHPVIGLPNFGLAGAVGCLLFALCGVAIVLYVRFLRQSRRFAVIGGKSRAATPQSLGRWRWLALAFAATWVVLAIVIPVATLFWVALVPYLQPFSLAALETATLTSFREAFDYMGTALRNTVALMAGAIVIAVTISIAISWVVTRSGSRLARWSDALLFLAPAVPAIVTAVAFQFLGIAIYHWLPLYATIWLTAIAVGTRMLAYCTRTMNAASLQISVELDEAARACGISRAVGFRRIFLPLMAPAVFYSALMVGMLAARDLTMPLIMNTGKSPTVSTLIFELQTNGDQNAAGAIALYMIVLLVAIAAAARWLTGMNEAAGEPHRRRLRPAAAERVA